MICAEAKKMNHLNTMYYNDILFRYFQIFLTNKLLHWNVSKSPSSNSITLSKGKANILSKHIYIIYRTSLQNVHWKSINCKLFFVKNIANPFTGGTTPTHPQKTDLLNLDCKKKRLLMVNKKIY